MAHKVKLTKITSTHNNVRTPIIEGETETLPIIGNDFIMTAPPLDSAASFRFIQTTPVRTLIDRGNGVLEFTTNNSTYTLEPLNDPRGSR